MLAFYLPYIVVDAALDLCAASFSMWQLMRREPVTCVMEETSPARIARR